MTLDRLEYIQYLLAIDPLAVIGYAHHRYECPLAFYINHCTGGTTCVTTKTFATRPNSISKPSPGRKQSRFPLPTWAVLHIRHIDHTFCRGAPVTASDAIAELHRTGDQP